MLHLMTRNLGYRTAAMDWLTALTIRPDAPDILFLQEVISTRLREIDAQYLVFARGRRGDRPHGRDSVIAVRRDLNIAVEQDDDTFGLLGSYASCVRLVLDRPIVLASVHTSPRPYDGPPIAGLAARSECESTPWWSDALVHDMTQHRGTPMVVAGDLNEARRWDVQNPRHSCSNRFFELVEEAGFVDLTFRDWRKQERPTRWSPDYQLDRVLASEGAQALTHVRDAHPRDDGVSDHAAIAFTLSPSGTVGGQD